MKHDYDLTSKAVKRAMAEIDACDDGGEAWRVAAIILMVCGGFWILLGLVALLQQSYCFLAFGILHLLVGLLILLLLAKSKRFRAFASRDFENDKTANTATKIFQAVVVGGIYIGLLVACAKIFGI